MSFSAWVFAAIYYWMGWAFLVLIVFGFLINIYLACCRRRSLSGQEDEAGLLDEDANPFGGEGADVGQEQHT